MSISDNSFRDFDDDKSLGMDTSVCFLTTKNNGMFILPFIYVPLASESSSDDTRSDTKEDIDGSDLSDEDSAPLGNTDW